MTHYTALILIFAGVVLATAAAEPVRAASAGAPCYFADDACLSAADLAAQGIARVAFVGKGLSRDADAGTTSWSLLAFTGSEAAPGSTLKATLPELVQGEEAVLLSPDAVCAPLVAAGITCERNPVAGVWASGEGSVTLTSVSMSAFSGKGDYKEGGLLCRDAASGVDRVWSCVGSYFVSLRLFYMNNAATLTIVEASCADTGVSRAVDLTVARPACNGAAPGAALHPGAYRLTQDGQGGFGVQAVGAAQAGLLWTRPL